MTECDDQSETLAFLADGAAFGVSGPVERIDTHAAVVFLAGERAYKMKRAVKLGYLDFSSLEKRKAVCEAELRLNRRTAPELYLDLVCVGRLADGTLALGEGEPVDWLIVMRRFASDRLLAAMVDEGPLDPGLIRDLADTIARFHDEAEIVAGDGAARARKVIDGNREAMAALSPEALDPEACADLHARSLEALDAVAPLLDRRGASGEVRHCHGDLHLANICLWQGRPTLFDCLEFDAALATTDTLYDLAFLVMDLCQRSQHAAASLVLNRYCDMRGEAEGLAALPLFLSMRAAVRAHVNATAAERQVEGDAKVRKAEAARAYLRTALADLDRDEPVLVAVGGLSGTGKSTLARGLAPALGRAPGARWLRTDVLRKRIAGVAPEQRLPPEAYSREQGAKVYARLADEAHEVLTAGMPVIVDGVFSAEDEREAVFGVAGAAGVRFTGLWLEASPDVLRSRVSARTGDASDADAEIVGRQLDYDIGDLGCWQRLPASGAPEEVLASARRLVGLGAS
ncbi:hypothetical protein B2G71_05570 [Novosphingobium sp. PC22D]|uniref:bifunctional aminoglycoside phosphotransferase/ATP-binding protein n=1 Tax=Novosphingobium sp. PC22D TaxID=1962403 RepID=UPI000BFAC055|nr:bifunctional aminoglycoside phosphotransferase/ATP-binding protein [Novosphingobium sp. PC22D]PEQ13782.1 hypothetical protein B2G71_05570 [Novosphingobium sp. PC22D]